LPVRKRSGLHGRRLRYDFKTGQFITLYWPDTPAYKRAYSLSSCALDRGFYEVTVKRDGKMGTRIVVLGQTGR